MQNAARVSVFPALRMTREGGSEINSFSDFPAPLLKSDLCDHNS